METGKMTEDFSDEAGQDSLQQIDSAKLRHKIHPAFLSAGDRRKPGQACNLKNPGSKESSTDTNAVLSNTREDAPQLSGVPSTNNGPSDPNSLLPFNSSLRSALHHSCFHEVVDTDIAPLACGAASWLNCSESSPLWGMYRGIQRTWDAWAALETMKEVAVSVSRLHSHGIAHGTIQADKVKLSHSNKDRRGFEASIELGWPAVVGGRGMKAPISPCSPFAWESHHYVNNIIDRLVLKESLSGYLPATIDVLYIGIMLWEIFVQEDIYTDVGLDMLQACLEKGDKPTMPLETPGRYRQLVEQCLDADPNARPTAEKLLLELTAIQWMLTGRYGPDSPCRILTWGLCEVTFADSQLRRGMEAESEVQSEVQSEVDVESAHELRRMNAQMNVLSQEIDGDLHVPGTLLDSKSACSLAESMGTLGEPVLPKTGGGLCPQQTPPEDSALVMGACGEPVLPQTDRRLSPQQTSPEDSTLGMLQFVSEPLPHDTSDQYISAQPVLDIEARALLGCNSGLSSCHSSGSVHSVDSHDTIASLKDFPMTDSMMTSVMDAYSNLVPDSADPVNQTTTDPVGQLSHVLMAYGLL